jgi:hypothetical protein
VAIGVPEIASAPAPLRPSESEPSEPISIVAAPPAVVKLRAGPMPLESMVIVSGVSEPSARPSEGKS